MLTCGIRYTISTDIEEHGNFTDNFITIVNTVGRMVDARVYVGNELTYTGEEVNYIQLTQDSSLLKSVMKMAEIEFNGLRVLNDTVFSDIQLGVSLDGDTYYYVSYGSFTVTENEQDLAKRTTKVIAYDGMLASMRKYDLTIDYTSSIVNMDYLTEIANELGFQVGASIPQTGVMAISRMTETYNDTYTYRDILDDFAEILGGCIIVKNNTLELLKPTDTTYIIDEEQLKTINLKEEFGEVVSLVLARVPQEDTVYYNPEGEIIGEEIRIENNQLVEGYLIDGVPDRTPYLEPIFNNLTSWSPYTTVELDSFGYMLFEPCDIVQIMLEDDDEETSRYILWLNSRLIFNGGISETMESNIPDTAITDYSKSTSNSRQERDTYLIVDKVNQTITSMVNSIQEDIDDIENRVTTNETNITQNANAIELKASTSYVDSEVGAVGDRVTTLETSVVIDTNGLKLTQGTEGSYVQITDSGMEIYVDNQVQAYATSEGFQATTFITGDWHIQSANRGKSLNFFRRS